MKKAFTAIKSIFSLKNGYSVLKGNFMVLCLVMVTGTANAQKVTTDAAGNYVAVKADKRAKGDTVATGKTFTDSKGVAYPVFKVAKSGKFFAAVTSKGGKYYRRYFTAN